MQLALANEREQRGHFSVSISSPATVVKVCVTVQSASTLNKGDSAAQKRYKVGTQNKQKNPNLKQKKGYFKLLSFGDCLLWRPNAPDTLVLMKCYSFTEKKHRGTEHHGKSETEETWALLHDSMCMICGYIRRLLTGTLLKLIFLPVGTSKTAQSP